MTLGLCAWVEHGGFCKGTERFLPLDVFLMTIPTSTHTELGRSHGEAGSRCLHRLGDKEAQRPAIYSQWPRGAKAACWRSLQHLRVPARWSGQALSVLCGYRWAGRGPSFIPLIFQQEPDWGKVVSTGGKKPQK